VFLSCLLGCLATRGPRDLIVQVPERKSCLFGTGAAADGFPFFRDDAKRPEQGGSHD
jgi:hypothetical protein